MANEILVLFAGWLARVQCVNEILVFLRIGKYGVSWIMSWKNVDLVSLDTLFYACWLIVFSWFIFVSRYFFFFFYIYFFQCFWKESEERKRWSIASSWEGPQGILCETEILIWCLNFQIVLFVWTNNYCIAVAQYSRFVHWFWIWLGS